MSATVRSKFMDELYGTEESIWVFELLEELDPKLNEIVQTIAYDYFWALPGLSLRDKSLVTIASLVSLRNEAQIKPHIIGFLNNEGTPKELVDVLLYLSTSLGLSCIEDTFETLCDVLNDKNVEPDFLKEMRIYFQTAVTISNNDLEKNTRDMHIANVASSAALGDHKKTKEGMKYFLNQAEASELELRCILIHLIVYCGFPVAMNGFSALQAVLEEN